MNKTIFYIFLSFCLVALIVAIIGLLKDGKNGHYRTPKIYYCWGCGKRMYYSDQSMQEFGEEGERPYYHRYCDSCK